MKREDAKVKVFRVPREANYKVDMVPKLATLGIIEMPVNILVEVADVGPRVHS